MYNNNSETKLRLIRNSHFGLKAYLKDTKASDLLMLKLNMVDLKQTTRLSIKTILVEDVENIKNMWNIYGNARNLK